MKVKLSSKNYQSQTTTDQWAIVYLLFGSVGPVFNVNLKSEYLQNNFFQPKKVSLTHFLWKTCKRTDFYWAHCKRL